VVSKPTAKNTNTAAWMTRAMQATSRGEATTRTLAAFGSAVPAGCGPADPRHPQHVAVEREVTPGWWIAHRARSIRRRRMTPDRAAGSVNHSRPIGHRRRDHGAGIAVVLAAADLSSGSGKRWLAWRQFGGEAPAPAAAGGRAPARALNKMCA